MESCPRVCLGTAFDVGSVYRERDWSQARLPRRGSSAIGSSLFLEDAAPCCILRCNGATHLHFRFPTCVASGKKAWQKGLKEDVADAGQRLAVRHSKFQTRGFREYWIRR